MHWYTHTHRGTGNQALAHALQQGATLRLLQERRDNNEGAITRLDPSTMATPTGTQYGWHNKPQCYGSGPRICRPDHGRSHAMKRASKKQRTQTGPLQNNNYDDHDGDVGNGQNSKTSSGQFEELKMVGTKRMTGERDQCHRVTKNEQSKDGRYVVGKENTDVADWLKNDVTSIGNEQRVWGWSKKRKRL